MAGANRIVIPEFPLALPDYDALNEEEFRKLVRDGFAGVEEYTGRATREYGVDEATPPADGDVLTWDGTNNKWSFAAPASGSLIGHVASTAYATSDTNYNTAISVTIDQTGYYALYGCLRGYTTAASDLIYRFAYKSSATGYITTDWATELIIPITEGGTTGQINYTSSGARILQFGGWIDVSSISGDNTFQVEFKRWSGTTDTCYVSAGSYVILTRTADT